jgi:hypothetical protein
MLGLIFREPNHYSNLFKFWCGASCIWESLGFSLSGISVRESRDELSGEESVAVNISEWLERFSTNIVCKKEKQQIKRRN